LRPNIADTMANREITAAFVRFTSPVLVIPGCRDTSSGYPHASLKLRIDSTALKGSYAAFAKP